MKIKALFPAILAANFIIFLFQTSLNAEAISSHENVHSTTAIVGTIWLEDDMNSTFDGEYGPDGVIVYLINEETGESVDTSISIDGGYKFQLIPPGKYYLAIDTEAFLEGGVLAGAISCPGVNPADDMIDNDDNGGEIVPASVISSTFTLENDDPTDVIQIDYIDFCFSYDCDRIIHTLKENCMALDDEDIICDMQVLDKYCGLMPTLASSGPQPEPLCPGGGDAENISWLSFVAGNGTYSIDIAPSNCTGGAAAGMQVGIYLDCDTESEPIFCSGDCEQGLISIPSDILTSGDVYYLFLDGCEGSVCNYSIEVEGTYSEPFYNPQDVCVYNDGVLVCDTISYCEGGEVEFEVSGVSNTADYTWSITSIDGGVYTGDSIQMTTSENLTLIFENEGKYNVCLTQIANGCASMEWNGVLCRYIEISSNLDIPEDEIFSSQLICVGDEGNFDIGVFDLDDPNGDGVLGWQGAESDFIIGQNVAVIPVDGCTYTQEFTLDNYPESPTEEVMISVCEDDLPIVIDDITVNDNSFLGTNIFYLENLILQNDTDVNGCDSTINLTVEKLSIVDGVLSTPVCLPQGLVIQFDYLADVSTEISFISFSWFDNAGNAITDNFNPADPTDILIPTSSGSGFYNLNAIINKDGTTCIYTYTIYAEFELFLPPQPDIVGPAVVCQDGNTVQYQANNGGDATNYNWSFPTDVAFGSIGGTNNDLLTIDWTGSAGGLVSVTGENACGESEPANLQVSVFEGSMASIVGESSACVNVATTFTYGGNPNDINTYNWDFGSGTILNGTGAGPGPHEVVYNSTGSQNIFLSVVDNNGCTSPTVLFPLEVVSPINPPLVNCTSSEGTVTFTWDANHPGTAGFNVIVTSGQTGEYEEGMYTLTGLADGEIVDIEFLTFPSDITCGEIITTTHSCEAQDCMPAIIELESSATSVCLDENGTDNIQLTASITSGETGVGTFIGPGIIDSENGIFDPDSADIGENTIVYSFSTDGANPCFSVALISINVNETPEASFISDLNEICVGEFLELNYSGTPGVTDYVWDYGVDGTGTGGENPIISYTSAGVKEISLSVMKDGCVSETFTSTLSVAENLTADFTTGFVGACIGDEISIMYTGDSGADNYIWDYGVDGTGTGGENPIVTYTSEGVKEISLMVSQGDCVSEPVTMSITIYDQPTSSFTASTLEACVGEEIELTYTGDDIGGNYFWNFGAGSSSTGDENPLVNYDSPGEREISLSVINGACSSDTFSLNVTITDGPDASFSVSADTICIIDELELTYTGTEDYDNITWDFGADGSGGDGEMPMVSYSLPGIKEITLNVSQGDCNSGDVTQTVVVQEELDPINILCEAGLGFILFDWNDMDGADGYTVSIDGGTPMEVSMSEFLVENLMEGQLVSIAVMANSDSKCPSFSYTITCESQVDVSVDDVLQGVSVYPNPMESVLFIDSDEYKNWGYSFTDISGRFVRLGTTDGSIQTEDLDSGIYLLLLTEPTTGKRGIFKMIKK